MNNDAVLQEGNVVQPEILGPRVSAEGKNLITVMVLAITVAHQILGNKAPKNGKLKGQQGQQIIKAIEAAVKHTFPDIAPMILSLFGVEILSLMPLISNPETIVKDMIADFINKSANSACPNPQPNVG